METLSELQIVLICRIESLHLGQGSLSPLGFQLPPYSPPLFGGTLGHVEDLEGMYPSSSLPRIMTKMPLSVFGVEETAYSYV